MIGMSAVTGLGLDETAHVRQSIRDILLTPLGTRVMRREYGSMLFALIDAPMDGATVLDIIQASAGAIGRWEPRVVVQRVAVADVAPGHVQIDLDLLSRATGAPIRLADALRPEPDPFVRVTDTDAIRTDNEGRLRIVSPLTRSAAPTVDPQDFGAALGRVGDSALSVTLGASSALAGAPLAESIYYVSEDEEALVVKVGTAVIDGEGESPYAHVILTIPDGEL